MDGMIAIADAIDRIADERHRRLTDDEKIEVDDVLFAAVDVDNGALPLEAFARIGTVVSPNGRPSAAYTRYLAMLSTPLSDPRRMPLRRAIDGLLRMQGLIVTTQGLFEPSEIPDVAIHRAVDPWEGRQAA